MRKIILAALIMAFAGAATRERPVKHPEPDPTSGEQVCYTTRQRADGCKSGYCLSTWIVERYATREEVDRFVVTLQVKQREAVITVPVAGATLVIYRKLVYFAGCP